MNEISNFVSRQESIDDVTLQYVDLESHKKMLEEEQKRLLELMEKAETMEDIITIESRLTEVRYQLESMEAVSYTHLDVYKRQRWRSCKDKFPRSKVG